MLFLREQSRLPGVSGAAPAYLAVAAGPAPTAWSESVTGLCVSTLKFATALRDVQLPACSPFTCGQAVFRNMVGPAERVTRSSLVVQLFHFGVIWVEPATL